jgi:ACS family glucarate transporter-like MFS transporter
MDFVDPVKEQPTRVRYLIVLAATLMAVVLYLHRISFSFAETYIRKDLGLSDVESARMLSAFFWAYALGQVPAGFLGDRWGVRPMLTLYILLWSLFTGLTGLATMFVVILALRLGCGLAQAGAFPASAGLLSLWIPFSGRARASAVVSLGGRLGGAAAPVLTAYLLVAFEPVGDPSLLGVSPWRPTMLVYGVVGLLVALLFWAVFRERPAAHPWANAGEVALIATGRPTGAAPAGRAGALPLGAMLRSRSLGLSSVAQFTTNFGWVFLITWLPRYLEEAHRVPVEERGWMASVPLTAGMAGMLVGGWVTDRLTRALGLRWGRGLPMALTRFAAMASFLACLALDSPWAVTVALAGVAVSVDLGTPAVWAFKQDIGGPYVGSVLGWGNMWGNIGAAVSPLVLEQLRVRFSWDAVFLACAASFLISGLVSLGVDARVPILGRRTD